MDIKLFFPILFFLASITFTPGVFAQKPEAKGSMQDKMMRTQGTPVEGRMRACQVREASVKNRMTHLSQLGATMQEKFDRHVAQIEDYYANKVIPSGKTMANYNLLLDAIQAKKTVVQAALITAQNDANDFSCTNNPKEQVTKFREDMQAVKKALHEYRASIKDLIVAINAIKGTENQISPTEEP